MTELRSSFVLEIERVRQLVVDAQASTSTDRRGAQSLNAVRKVIEAIARDLYRHEVGDPRGIHSLDALLKAVAPALERQERFPSWLGTALGTGQIWGNRGSHDSPSPVPEGIVQFNVSLLEPRPRLTPRGIASSASVRASRADRSMASPAVGITRYRTAPDALARSSAARVQSTSTGGEEAD